MKTRVACFFLYLSTSFFCLSAHGATDFCGLGPPPNAPNYAAFKSAKAVEMKEKEFLRVCEADLKQFEMSYRETDVYQASLDFDPVSINGTPFARLKNLGGTPEKFGEKNSGLYRGFRTSEGHVITLFEHDMSADGSSAWLEQEDALERVNGIPARLIVLEAPSGKAISQISWIERRRFYRVWIDINVATLPWRERLFALASSLPPSVAACPNEIPPKPFRLGADGLPESDPLPKILTQAEMEKRFPRVRPCK